MDLRLTSKEVAAAPLSDLVAYFEEDSIPVEVLWEMIGRPNQALRMRLLSRSELTSEMLYSIVSSTPQKFMRTVALKAIQHPHIGEKTSNFIKLWATPDAGSSPPKGNDLVVNKLYEYSLIDPAEEVNDVLQGRSNNFLVLSSPLIPVEILEKVSQHKNIFYRALIAKNAATPPEILTKLYWENLHHYKVTTPVLKNPKTPWEVLKDTKRHNDLRLYNTALENPSYPSELLIQALESGHSSALGNPSLPSHILNEYAKKETLTDDGVTSLLLNKNLTHEMLIAIMHNSYFFTPFMIEGVTKNENISFFDKIYVLLETRIPHPEMKEIIEFNPFTRLHTVYSTLFLEFVPTIAEVLEAYGVPGDMSDIPKTIQWEMLKMLASPKS